MTISKQKFTRLVASAARRLFATLSLAGAADGRIRSSRLRLKIEPLDGVSKRAVPSVAVHRAIIDTLDNLPATARLVFLMSWVDRLSYSEIAHRLGLSRWAVRRAMALAIAAVAHAVLVAQPDNGEGA